MSSLHGLSVSLTLGWVSVEPLLRYYHPRENTKLHLMQQYNNSHWDEYKHRQKELALKVNVKVIKSTIKTQLTRKYTKSLLDVLSN